jgi:MFS family permease
MGPDQLMSERPGLWSKNFAVLCAATFALFTSLMMQVPVFPDFLRARADASPTMIGVFIGLFSPLAIIARPWIGHDLTRRSRRTYMTMGGAIAAAAAAVYWVAGSLALLLPVRLVHGLCIAAYYTASATLVADVAPVERRGQAISYFSMFQYLGIAGGPALGVALRHAGGFGAVFASSLVLALIAIGLSSVVREPIVHAPETIQIEGGSLISRPALFPAAVLFFAAVSYSAAFNFTADFADKKSIGGAALYFPVLAGVVIATRAFAGGLSDRYGRIVVAAPGAALLAVAMWLQAAAHSAAPLLVSAAIVGAGFGLFFPSIFAFTMDRVTESERGAAMATFTIAPDLAFGIGSPLLGWIIGTAGYPVMYVVAGIFALASLAVLAGGTSLRVRLDARG